MSDPKPAPKDEKLEEKLEASRAALKANVRGAFAAGRRDGLRAEQVEALQAALVALGWLPPDAVR